MIRSAVKAEFETEQVWQQNPQRKEAQVGSYVYFHCVQKYRAFPPP